MIADEDYLRIGDVVVFKNIKFEKYLCSDGILAENLNVNSCDDMLDDYLFAVHFQRQYSAALEFTDYESSSTNRNSKLNVSTIHKALQRGRDNETALNDAYMETKTGEMLSFGSIIQLFHIKSQKYVTVLPGRLADGERENLRITLDPQGSTYSWIEIAPRFKIDKDGDPVLTNTEMYLKFIERPSEYIHVAELNPVGDRLREVNCSLESSAWKMTIFQSSLDSKLALDVTRKIVLASQIVYINDPETRCNLTIATDGKVKLEGPEEDAGDGENNGETKTGATDKGEDENNNTDENAFSHEFGNIVLEPTTDTTTISSRMLWFLESKVPLKGGAIRWKTDGVRLKHVNTGLYLQLLTETEVRSEGNVYTFALSTTPDGSLPGTILNIEDLAVGSKILSFERPVRMMKDGIYLERGEVLDNLNYVICGSTAVDRSVNFKIHKFRGDPSPEEEGMSSIKEPIEIFSGISIRNFLQRFYKMTQKPSSVYVSTIWPTADRADLDMFTKLMQRAVFFSQGFPISATDIVLGVDRAPTVVRLRRQKLMRDQGTLQVLIRMINALKFLSEKGNEGPQLTKTKVKYTEEEQMMMRMGRGILEKCFDLLFWCVQDNHDNQMYVADLLHVLLAHLGGQPMAGKCVTEMLASNMDLQENKIGTREIAIFVEKLRFSKMNSMYLQLLKACCSCQGNGIDANQGKVTELLFSNTNDVIINLNSDSSRRKIVENEDNWWRLDDLYLPSTALPGSPVLAEQLVVAGLPKLSLAWTTKSIDFSPLGLFGKLSVDVEELYKPNSLLLGGGGPAGGTGKKLNVRKNVSIEQKLSVSKYFINQMFLCAEMCMDRNYVAMHTIDSMFPYEVLVTILRLDVVDTLKSAAARLLLCLHVDRDPQAMTKIPCFTRTWSEVLKGADGEPKLPFVEPGRRFIFGLVQQIVSDHVKNVMKGQRWTEYSMYILQLLKSMLGFNFYGTNERMLDVVGPMIEALDRRAVKEGGGNGGGLDGSLSRIDGEAQASPEKALDSMAVAPANGNDIEATSPEQLDNSTGPNGYGSSNSLWQSFISQFQRFLRAAQKVGGRRKKGVGSGEYTVPSRYSRCPQHELDTMVQGVEILQLCQAVIEDRNMTLLLKYFHLWESEKDARTPGELFEQVVYDSQQLTLGVKDFDEVFVDLLMFTSGPLVQSSLEILMAHHSSRKALLDNAAQVQLLASAKRERQFKIVDQMLQQLEQNAETHELWGELVTESDRAVSKQTADIMIELRDICRVRRKVLEFDQEYEPDSEMQVMFRNLGCFSICMKVLALLDFCGEHVDEETGEMDDVGLNTRNLCLLVNGLLYWFFLGNPENQELGFSELEGFISSLQENIESHKCIRAIFHRNERLMRMVSHSYIQDMTELICKAEPDERSPHYLALMMAITYVDDRGMRDNQLEIMKQLTSPGRAEKIACFFVPLDHPEYAQKVELMAAFADRQDVSVDELPPLLAYHLNLLELFASCTVSKIGGITSIEAKAQAIFSYEAAIAALLDPFTILIAKIRLAQFILNAVIEVEMMIAGLEYSACMWRLLRSFEESLATAPADFAQVAQLGWADPSICRQRIEYHIVCIQIISGFFSKYFDYGSFRIDDKPSSGHHSANNNKENGNSKLARLTSSELKTLLAALHKRVSEVEALDSPILSALHRRQISEAMVAIQKNVGKEMQSLHHHHTHQHPHSLPTVVEIDETAITSEERVIRKYAEFIKLLQEDENVQAGIAKQSEEFIHVLEKIPFVTDTHSTSDIRQESLYRKLVQHIRENISIVNNERRLNAQCTKTSIWLMKAFRTMLENKMGMTIYQRDDDGGQEEDRRVAPVIAALSSCGVVTLCIDLISVGIDPALQLEAVRLGVGLLYKEGGAIEVQTLINTHLSSTNSEFFFKQLHLSVQKLIEWHRLQDVVVLEDGQDPELPEELLIIRFMQLMSEGHFLPNQDIMREQPNNNTSHNILDDLVPYLACLSRLHCRTSTCASIRVAATILEVIQGPCKDNQFHLAMKTEILETLNRIMRSKPVFDCVYDEEIELKLIAVDIFQGLLEGQPLRSTVYERLLSVIHLDIILHLSGSVKDDPDLEQGHVANHSVNNTEKGLVKEMTEDEEVLRTQSLVLLQMLCDCKPSIRDEFGLSKNIEDILQSGTSVIEVIWNGDLQRRFFHVPDICDDVAKSSMDAFVEEVDRENVENQLIEFVEAARGIYREVKHMQRLRAKGLSGIFCKANQDRVSWFNFILSIVINGILLTCFTSSQGSIHLGFDVEPVIHGLNYLQIIISFFVLLCSLIIRSPVVMESLLDEEGGQDLTPFQLYFNTAIDRTTLYLVWYFAFSILGAFVSFYYCSFLLLDILAKNATTRAVLNSVVQPRQQLFWALVLGVIAIYIYSFYIFTHYPPDFDGNLPDACHTLWGCFKMSLYTIQSGGGVSDFMNVDYSSRLVLTISFYVVVMTILLNVIFGIIIDTFGSLREQKDERYYQTVNFCFICGIEKQVFDRVAVDSSDGFRRHIRVDHNMWNYLKFVIFIWEQDRDDDDGLEQFVRRSVDGADVSWMPIGKAMRLDQAESEEDRLYRESKLVINVSQQSLQHKIDTFQVDLSAQLLNLSETLMKASTVETENRASTAGGSRILKGGEGGEGGIGADLSLSQYSYGLHSSVDGGQSSTTRKTGGDQMGSLVEEGSTDSGFEASSLVISESGF